MFQRYFFHLPLPYWSQKMRHCETSCCCNVGIEFRNLMELMVEFYLLKPATHSCSLFYVRLPQRALLHQQDIIYQHVYRNCQAHRRLRGPRGGGGKTYRRCLFWEMEASTPARPFVWPLLSWRYIRRYISMDSQQGRRRKDRNTTTQKVEL